VSGSRRAIASWTVSLPKTRFFCKTIQRMTPSPLGAVSPPISTALPSDAFQLLPESEKAGQAEDALFEQQLKDVEAWWATPRYRGIKRPYSAVDVVSKRGSQMQSYPSSVMARKLFNLLTEREAKGEPIYTSARCPAFRPF
jgi:isocitrate lyase